MEIRALPLLKTQSVSRADLLAVRLKVGRMDLFSHQPISLQT
jgi:hypothetical protein